MSKLHRVSSFLVALSFFVPALAVAQATTGNGTVDAQMQALISQITSLQQQLRALVQSAASSSTSPMWNASSTMPGMMDDGQGMPAGSCGDFARNLSVGSQGGDVMQLQQMLSGDGFLSASSTGFFGPLTAHALQAFQAHFGIAASSTASGFFGPLTRTFLQNHCGGGQGMGMGDHMMMGSSTRPWMNGQGTSTWPTMRQGGQWMGTSTNEHMMMYGPMGSSSAPCQNNENQGAAAVLFVPHVILPMMPCGGSGGPGPQPGQGQVQGQGSGQ